MPAPKGGKRPGDRASPRPAGVRAGRAGRPSGPRAVAKRFDEGFPMHAPRPFRTEIEQRPESTAGLRHEIADLRAEVRRLAAEIDKLWARERGRGLPTPGRTARSIAGKPARTGTRAARPGQRGAGPRIPHSGAKRAGPGRGRAAGGRGAAGSKRSTGVKRSSGWAKPKSHSRRSGTTPRRKGR